MDTGYDWGLGPPRHFSPRIERMERIKITEPFENSSREAAARGEGRDFPYHFGVLGMKVSGARDTIRRVSGDFAFGKPGLGAGAGEKWKH